MQHDLRHETGTFRAFDGETIFHQSWLPDGAARAVVLLVHGLGEHSGRYDHVARTLVDAGYAVHALDHRGHGRSSGTRAFVTSYDEFLRDLHQFRRMVEHEHAGLPLVLLGHSMGGNIAMGYTLGNQDGIAALVLSGPALKIGDDFSPIQLKALGLISKVAPGLRPQGLSADAISRDPAVVAAYRDDPLVFTGKVSAGLGAALIGAMRSFPDRYAQLRLPVLVLHGTDDQLADVAGSRELEAKAVNADLTVHYYHGLYHEVFNEPEQDRVLADLTSWLGAHV
ncbi:MAG TPA: lysophospholipase [Ilumatobacter sp.]|nr:lysophospholipase [Ilumatobacter sp.]